MKRSWLILGGAFVVMLGADSTALGEPTVRPVGTGPSFNSDCMQGYTAHLTATNDGVGMRCNDECKYDGDCSGGMVCVRPPSVAGQISNAPTPLRCKPPYSGFMGRVERAPGEPVQCSIELYGNLARAHGSTISRTLTCDPTTGAFAAEDLPAGPYSLKITAGTPPFAVKREVQVPVNYGQVTYVGSVILPVPTSTVAPHPAPHGF